MKTYTYQPKGVCSRQIVVEVDEDRVITDVRFVGGCSGNTQGVSRLVEGMPAEEAVRRLSGIRCGSKNPSCPDQLASAIRQAMERENAARHSN